MNDVRSRARKVSKRLRIGTWFSWIALSVWKAVFIVFALAASPVNAANISVNSVAQSPGATGDCTLGEAIRAANSDVRVDACTRGSGADTITLPQGMYTLTRVNNNTDGPNGLPSIASNITINGAGATTTTVERSSREDIPRFRIFHVAAAGTLRLSGLTITGGFTPAVGIVQINGGGILNLGTVSINNSIIRVNTAVFGGGIYNSGTVTITNSTIPGNTAAFDGGGIYNSGTVTITNSTISDNTADFGGGIENSGFLHMTNSIISDNSVSLDRGGGGGLDSESGLATIVNSTIARNSAAIGGGISASDEAVTGNPVTIINSTISGNTARSFGGGIDNPDATVKLQNTVLAKNTAPSPDCFGFITSLGNNLIGDTTDCSINLQLTDLTGDPGLGIFTDPGTPGKGHFPLLPTSRAIDAGSADACPTTDQLGRQRVCVCDIGAVEFQPERTIDVAAGDANALINAINEANMNVSYDVINLAAGTHSSTSSLPSITSQICIKGASAGNTFIVRHMDVDSTGKLTLQNVTIMNASAQQGGGIFNKGTLALVNSSMSNNRAFERSQPFNAGGGGIYNTGTLSIFNSTVSENKVGDDGGGPGGGGGISNEGGVLIIVKSTISGNAAGAGGGTGGGGIFNFSGGRVAITNSTISGNRNDTSGGGIRNSGTVDLNNVTITKNIADVDATGAGTGGGISNGGAGTVNLKNTIIARNIRMMSTSDDCSGTLNSQGNNLIGTTSGCTISTTANITGMDPGLDPTLGGGPTQTHALLPNSPAIDSGNPDEPGSGGNACERTDQRGSHRPADGNGDGTTRCDIGAFELGPATPLGTNVTVQSGSVTIIFANVAASGNTTAIPIDPTTAGTLPSQFRLGAGLPAFDIRTTATVTGPITVCIQVPSVTDQTRFNMLRILHGEGGTMPVDRTILPPNSPAPDFSTKTICARVNALSPFVVAELVNNVNTLVTFDPIPDSFSTTFDTTGCPSGFVGKFSFSARFANTSTRSLSDLVVEVETLTNGNLLQNADGGPGGVGARLTVRRPEVDGFSDGVLSPTESVDVEFIICLKNKDPFRFFVNVLGIVQ